MLFFFEEFFFSFLRGLCLIEFDFFFLPFLVVESLFRVVWNVFFGFGLVFWFVL